MTLYNRVRRLCSDQGISISNLGDHLTDVDISKSAVSHWKNGSVPRAEVIKAIADFFGVSPDYIVKGDRAPATAADAICVPADSAPVAIIGGQKRKLSEQEVAVLHLCKDLDVVQKAKLLAYAAGLGS